MSKLDLYSKDLEQINLGNLGTRVDGKIYGWDIEEEIIRFEGKVVELEEDSDMDIESVDWDLSTLIVIVAGEEAYCAESVDQGFCRDIQGNLWWLDIINDGVCYKVTQK